MKGRASIKTKLSQKTPTHANKKHKGEKPCCMLCQMCHNTDIKLSSIVVAHCDNNSKLKVRILLDTGALQGNYISLKIARWLGGSLLIGHMDASLWS